MKVCIKRHVRRYLRWVHNRRFKYGFIINLDGSVRNRARINKKGHAEFVLWKAGEQGHKENYWHVMGYGWELQFKPDTQHH